MTLRLRGIRTTFLLGIFAGFIVVSSLRANDTPLLVLPTANHELLNGNPAGFYQYVKRDFEGQVSQPWEGGQYGFVRDPIRLGDQILYTRFHEGIDIKPLERDSQGEPEDVIHAIAAGRIAYINPLAGASNYGKYIVVEHQFWGCPYYSLYAHLQTITANVDQQVAQGDPIAIMGHTGEGIDRERSHVHLELNLMLNGHFAEWHDKYYPAESERHGNYNGINLAGLDIAKLYLELQKNPSLTIPEFIGQDEIWYRVRIPRSPNCDLQTRYPWLVKGSSEGAAWEIAFDRTSLPIEMKAVPDAVKEPVLSWVHPSPYPQQYLTKYHLISHGNRVELSNAGKKFLDLVSPGT